MASKKQPPSEPAKPNKFKFVYIEAYLSETNFSDLTSTIAQVMGRPPAQRQLANGKQTLALQNGLEQQESEDIAESEYEDVPEETPAADGTPKPARQPKPRKFKAPNVINELDLTGSGISFKDFAEQKNPTSKVMRYLVAMFWLKEYGNEPTVNADKIYTCFRKAKWPTNFNDWMQPFYNLVSAKDARSTDTGEFAINTTGEDKVNSGAE